MGPASDHQLTIAPPFYITMADLFGPLDVFVPGYERTTRNRKVLQAKAHIILFACPVTKLQVRVRSRFPNTLPHRPRHRLHEGPQRS